MTERNDENQQRSKYHVMPTQETVPYMLGQLVSRVDILLDRTAGYDKRLTAVERKQWWATGAAAVLGAVISHLAPLSGMLPKI